MSSRLAQRECAASHAERHTVVEPSARTLAQPRQELHELVILLLWPLRLIPGLRTSTPPLYSSSHSRAQTGPRGASAPNYQPRPDELVEQKRYPPGAGLAIGNRPELWLSMAPQPAGSALTRMPDQGSVRGTSRSSWRAPRICSSGAGLRQVQRLVRPLAQTVPPPVRDRSVRIHAGLEGTRRPRLGDLPTRRHGRTDGECPCRRDEEPN